MAYYRTEVVDAAVVTLDTILHLKGDGSVLAKLSEFIVSSNVAPVEQTQAYTVIRTTSTGTTPGDSTLGEVAVDPLSAAATVTAEGAGYGTEPTFSDPAGVMMRFGVHQKATFRWVAYPGREIHATVAANNGLGITCVFTSTSFGVVMSAEWEE